MRHWRRSIGIAVVLIIIGGAAYGLTQMGISALSPPGPVETALATRAKDWLINRAARGSLPTAPLENASSIATGNSLFGMACATCHGQDGRTPTPLGKSMYPRALDLGAPEVQTMSDAEIFWVTKNGIRLSGMPGFANINTDEQIWQLTYYIRSLGEQPRHRSHDKAH